MAGKGLRFSAKQLRVLTWWQNPRWEAVVCDGAVRSGKTFAMGLSFFLWAQAEFDGKQFGICGKTIASARRNLLSELSPYLRRVGMEIRERRGENALTVRFRGHENTFLLFGGRDESSAALIQGSTLAGVLLDEAALMPRSFVEQALARCSLENARYFFNCNPEHPYHWFYINWIKKYKEKNMLYVHFTMNDNPSLSDAVKNRYKSLYSGAFYERFIEGKWVTADGLVYPMFNHSIHIKQCETPISEYYLSCDYGTVNPFSLGLWGKGGDGWYRLDEYYHSSRDKGIQLTDEEYYQELLRLAGDREIKALIIDPSAASFIQTVKRNNRYRVIKADNDVLKGINQVCQVLKNNEIFISPHCTDTIREFSLYQWDNGIKKDAPKKENDHAMDDIRYFVSTVLKAQEETNDFISFAIERK